MGVGCVWRIIDRIARDRVISAHFAPLLPIEYDDLFVASFLFCFVFLFALSPHYLSILCVHYVCMKKRGKGRNRACVAIDVGVLVLQCSRGVAAVAAAMERHGAVHPIAVCAHSIHLKGPRR